MFLSAIILSILIGRLRGGRLSRFADIEFHKIGWILVSFAIRFGLAWAATRVEIPRSVAAMVHVSAYLMIIYAVARNTHLRGMWLVGLGTALNLAVVAANGGRMPILDAGLRRAGLDALPSYEMIGSGASYTHFLIDSSTHIPFLGDVLCIPKPFWPPTVFSAGDVVVMLGAFILVQSVMVPRRKTAVHA